MASLNSSESSPLNISFALRDQKTTNKTSPSKKFYRSISTKQQPSNLPPPFPFTPPRLPSLPQSLRNSPVSSPLHPTATASEKHPYHQCLSSVLKKDGQILSVATFNNDVYTGSDSNVIRIWKLPEFREFGELKTKASRVVAIVVSHDRVYAAYGDCKIRVWRRSWDRVLRHSRLATIPTIGSYVRSYITGKDKMMKHMGPITSLAINISDDLLYTSSLDKSIKVWKLSDFKYIETIHSHSDPVNAILAADDGLLYSASDDATVKVFRRNFSRSDHSLVVTLPAKSSPVKTLTLSTDGAVLYGGCSDGYVHYWLKGWFPGQLQYGGALQGHTHAVMSLSTSGKFTVSGSADATCRVWTRDGNRHVCLAVLVGHRGPVRCVAVVSGDGCSIAAAAAEDEEEEGSDGCTICSGSLDGVVKIWRVMSKKGRNQNDYSSLENESDNFEF